ncbi:MAG TPA: DUF4832 domain-containing protein, partial [Opitutaceae bacterium]|nr:DUF4832 domain-containing protein [Opitutaceae bacterium]
IAAMIREMELVHASYLNIGHHPRVLQLWRETEHAGENTFTHIARRLGYRFVAERLKITRSPRDGGSLDVDLTLKNTGFAPPYHPRSVELALLSRDGKPVSSLVLSHADPRRWSPEAGAIQLNASLPMRGDYAAGSLRLALRLADPSERLREDARYAIRLANRDVAFLDSGGWNVLAEDPAR